MLEISNLNFKLRFIWNFVFPFTSLLVSKQVMKWSCNIHMFTVVALCWIQEEIWLALTQQYLLEQVSTILMFVCFNHDVWLQKIQMYNVKCLWQLLIMLKVARRWSRWDLERSNYYPHVFCGTNKSGTSAGVGFAIPSDVVSKIVSQLIAFGDGYKNVGTFLKAYVFPTPFLRKLACTNSVNDQLLKQYG